MVFIVFFACLVIYALLYNYIQSETIRKTIFIIFLSVACILSGMRDLLSYSTDDMAYHNVYNAMPGIEDVFRVYRGKESSICEYEIGYVVFVSIIKSMGFSFKGMCLIDSIILYLCMYHGMKRYMNNYSVFLLVFMYKLFTYYTMIAMRQGLAMSVFFLSIKFIEERKLIKYYLMCILAITFHNGAMYLLLAYFVVYIPLDKKLYKTILIVSACCLVFRFAHINLFAPIAKLIGQLPFVSENKADALDLETISLLHTAEFFAISGICCIFYDNIKNSENHVEFIIKISLMLAPIFTVFSMVGSFTRIKDYFTPIYAFMLVYISKSFVERKEKMVFFLIVIVWAVYGFFRHLLNFGGGFVYKYYVNWLPHLFDSISILFIR